MCIHMSISYSGSKRGLTSSSVGVVVRRDDGRGIEVKENDSGRWSSDGVVL
jgi:hypothetical protein